MLKKRHIKSYAALLSLFGALWMSICAAGDMEGLRNQLRDEDPAVRLNAAVELRDMGEEAADALPDLIEAFGDEKAYVAQMASNAAMAIGEPAIPALAGALEDETPEVRYLALNALAEIGAEAQEALEAVLDGLIDPEPLVSVMAERALVRIGVDKPYEFIDKLAPAEEESEKRKYSRALAIITLAEDDELRKGVVDKLENLPPDLTEYVLWEWVRMPQTENRDVLLLRALDGIDWSAGDIRDTELSRKTGAALARMFLKRTNDIQKKALKELKSCGEIEAQQAAVEVFIEQIKEDGLHRQSAVDGLLRLHEEDIYPEAIVEKGGEEAKTLLENVLLHTADTELQWATIEGLREIVGDYETVELLMEKYRSDDEALFDAAVDGLLRLYEEGVYPDVIVEKRGEGAVSLLKSVVRGTHDLELHWATIGGLREVVGDYETIGFLIDKLRSDDETRSAAIEQGLLRLNEEDIYPDALIERGDADAVSRIVDVMWFGVEPSLQLVSVGALRDIGGDAAEEALAEAMNEGGWLIKRYAAKALDEMGLETDPQLLEEVEGWPMWRYRPDRSAASMHQLPEELHLQWVRELPEPRRAWPQQQDDGSTLQFDVSYTPVSTGGRVFVPSMVTDSVTAYSLEDGSKLWRFYADGPVRLAPAVWHGKVYFASDDGHLYCVDADSGELEWRFRGAPAERYLLGNTRLISQWYARTGPVI